MRVQGDTAILTVKRVVALFVFLQGVTKIHCSCKTISTKRFGRIYYWRRGTCYQFLLDDSNTPAMCNIRVWCGVLSALKTDQRGRSFLVAFVEKDYACDNLLVIISEDDATVYVKIPTKKTLHYKIEAMGAVHVSLPHQARVSSDMHVNRNTVFIVASTKVSVYGYSMGNNSIGGFLALPVESLGTRYLTVGKKQGGQIVVAATEDDTEISIKMRLNSDAECGNVTLRDGQLLKLKLKRHQAVHLICNMDTSGSLVQADKPVAVFSGSTSNEVTEMMPPTNSLGMDYILYPILDRNTETVYRIIAKSDETTVTNSVWTHQLESQDFVDITLKETDFTCFRSTKPVMVAQFIENNNGGQFLNIIPCTEHFAADYIMDTTVVRQSRNITPYVTAVIPESTNLELNFMKSSAMHVIEDCHYRVGTAEIPRGIIKLSQSNGAPFGIITYGFGKDEMYSFSAGITFFESSGTEHCANVTCENKGLCYETRISYECFCADGFTGRHCEFNRSSEPEEDYEDTTKIHITDSSPNCRCKCANITWEEVYEQVEVVKKELTVDRQLLSKQKRKKATAQDTRPSTAGVGCVGVTFLAVVFGSILLIDLVSAVRYFVGRIKEWRRSRQKPGGSTASVRRKHLMHVHHEGIVLHIMDENWKFVHSRASIPPVRS